MQKIHGIVGKILKILFWVIVAFEIIGEILVITAALLLKEGQANQDLITAISGTFNVFLLLVIIIFLLWLFKKATWLQLAITAFLGANSCMFLAILYTSFSMSGKASLFAIINLLLFLSSVYFLNNYKKWQQENK